MTLPPGILLCACLALTAWCVPAASAPPVGFSFGIIAHTASRAPDDAALREAIAASDADNLAFVVASGIKAAHEPCTDNLFFRRKELFQSAKNGLILSIAASDWSGCKTESGHSSAIERLNRIRDLFFDNPYSFGASKLPMTRQANMPKFRTYVENVRWDIGNMVFATINLPANNNDYLPAAGRNNEFDDRLIADRDWLHRIFVVATQKNAAGIVLFSDGNPLAVPDLVARIGFGVRRDGFTEIRKQILTLSARFAGKVLLVSGHGSNPRTEAEGIVWHNNLGTVSPGSGWLKINVNPGGALLLAVEQATPVLKTAGP